MNKYKFIRLNTNITNIIQINTINPLKRLCKSIVNNHSSNSLSLPKSKNIFYKIRNNFFSNIDKDLQKTNDKNFSKNLCTLEENYDSANPGETITCQIASENKKDLISKDFEKAKDFFNHINIKFHTVNIEDAIKILLICTDFNCYPPELIPKLEKSLTKVILNMNELQLTKTIYGFSILKYHTPNLSFFYERALSKHIISFSTQNFNTIFKSLTRLGYSSKNLLSLIRNYINMNLNKLSLQESCDIFCNYNKLIKIAEEDDKILMKKLFDQIFPHYIKLNMPHLIHFYFILYSQKNTEISELYKNIYTDRADEIKNQVEGFFKLFNEGKNEINSMLIYLIIITNHFSDKTYENLLKVILSKNIHLVFELFIKNLNLFSPFEINTIITIFINNKEIFNFKDSDRHEIYQKFIQTCSTDLADMNNDEVVLYLQSLLIISKEDANSTQDSLKGFNEVLKNFNEDILTRRINSFTIQQFSSLIQIIHYFKIKEFQYQNIQAYENCMDLIAEKIINCLETQTTNQLRNIFDDYYLIARYLFDLKYQKKIFWEKYFKYLELFEAVEKESKNEYNLNKIKVIKSIKSKIE